MDAHQAEAVRGVRTPIVVRPEPDVSIIVGLLFVIPADRVAGFSGFRVEEDPRAARFQFELLPRGRPGSGSPDIKGSLADCALVRCREGLVSIQIVMGRGAVVAQTAGQTACARARASGRRTFTNKPCPYAAGAKKVAGLFSWNPNRHGTLLPQFIERPEAAPNSQFKGI